MSIKLKEFYKEIYEEKDNNNNKLNEGFLSNFFENIILLLARDQIKDAYEKMKNDPELIKKAKNIKKAQDELRDVLLNSPAVDKWYEDNK